MSHYSEWIKLYEEWTDHTWIEEIHCIVRLHSLLQLMYEPDSKELQKQFDA